MIEVHQYRVLYLNLDELVKFQGYYALQGLYFISAVFPPKLQWASPSKVKVKTTQVDKLRLKCKYEGNPSPDISWLKDGENVFSHKVIHKK